MKRIVLRVLFITLLTSILGGVAYYQSDMELSLGLDNLFKLRGTRPVPSEIVIVAMDKPSREYLNVSSDLKEWRKYHANLIKELNRQGALLIVFDLYFKKKQENIDKEFAEAIKSAGNVLATECAIMLIVNDKDLSGEECSDEILEKESKREINSKGRFIKYLPPTLPENILLDYTPYFLPQDVENLTIREAWNFSPQLDETLRPTMPIVLLLNYLDKTGVLQKIPPANFPLSFQPNERLSKWLIESRTTCLLTRSEHQKAIITPLESQLNDLICGEDNSQYIDFYGPAKTVRRVSYKDVYAGNETDFKGKVVFVGLEGEYKAKKDNFQTPFTNSETGQTFGIEIMATQFANLLENRKIDSPFPPILTFIAFGLVIGMLLIRFNVLIGMTTSLLFSGSYIALAVWLFARQGFWLPIAIPLLIQNPITLIFSLLWSRWDLLAENKRLVAKVIQEWNTVENATAIEKDRNTYGLCLATDIVDYSRVAARYQPQEIRTLLNGYHFILGEPVLTNGGIIADATGDAMMAIWIELDIDELRLTACKAALEMQQAVELFNVTSMDKLNTRIGIHEGELSLGTLLRQYRAFGSTLAAASRIEGVNKLLNTRILTTKFIVGGLPSIYSRSVGCFLLRGLEELGAFELVELVGFEEAIDDSTKELHRQFVSGLSAFQQGQWEEAITQFQVILNNINNEDGPTLYYLKKARAFLRRPPQNWQGIIHLS